MWKFEKDFANLLKETIDLLSDDALFFLINSYTAGISSLVLENMMREMILPKHPGGTIDTGDIAIPLQKREIVLPCGIYGRWQRS